MADIYVDATNGNDTTGAGTSGNPYATIAKAFTVFAQGDTVKVANTGVQAIGDLAYFTAGSTSDEWAIIEGWDNGGSQVIERPDGNLTDVGVIEGRFTGSKSFIKFKNLKFQNYNIGNNAGVNSNNSTQIFENCDFVDLTVLNGQIIGLNANSSVRFCSFRNITVSGTGSIINKSSAATSIYGNYFYNCKNCISGTGTNSSIHSNIFDQVEGYGISMGGDRDHIFNNTFIGDGSSSNFGITFSVTTAEYISIFNNHFQDFSGASSAAVNNTAVLWVAVHGGFDLVGGNSFYNNTNNYQSGGNFAAAIMSDLRSLDIQEVAEPLVDKAAFDYRKKTTALSYGQQPIFAGWNYTETPTNMTTGAAQNEGGGGGGGGDTESSYAGV